MFFGNISKNRGSPFALTSLPNSIFRWNDKRLPYFVIPAQAGIQVQLPLIIELLCFLVHRGFEQIKKKIHAGN